MTHGYGDPIPAKPWEDPNRLLPDEYRACILMHLEDVVALVRGHEDATVSSSLARNMLKTLIVTTERVSHLANEWLTSTGDRA